MLKIFGWKVTGSIPADLKKYVVIAAPHTSAVDFPIGVWARSAIGRDIKYLGKKSLFKPPLGWLMRKLGGYPVDRSGNQNLVAQVVELFNSKDAFAIALSPEGTRRKVDRLRTGFYHIAVGAKVPIVLVTFDYDARIVHFNPEPFYPTGDKEEDLKFIWDYYKGVKGKVPEYSIS